MRPRLMPKKVKLLKAMALPWTITRAKIFKIYFLGGKKVGEYLEEGVPLGRFNEFFADGSKFT